MNTKNIDRMRNLNVVLFAGILASYMGWSTDAFAEAHCYCHLSCYNQTGTSIGSDLKDYGWLDTYTGIDQQNEAHQVLCQAKCKAASLVDIGSQTIATAACAMNCPNGTVVRAYSAAGNKPYREASDGQPIGTLVNKPAWTSYVYDCGPFPGTWLDNPSAGNGGHARCVKNSCNAASGVPTAPSWVSIGTAWTSATGPAWVTDGSGNIWYGVPAHATPTVHPAECHF